MTILPSRLFALLPALLALAEPSPSQITTMTVWPVEFMSGSFRRSVIGDFHGDLRKSAVVHRGDDLYFAFDPAFYSAISYIASGQDVDDVVTLPGVGQQGRDAILATSPAGALRGEIDAETNAFGFVPVLDASWAGARGLTARSDSNGTLIRLAAVAADGVTVLTAEASLLGGFVAGPAVPVSVPVFEVELLDWDGDGALELVAVAVDGGHPFELDGSPLPVVTAPLVNAASTVVRDQGAGERIACVSQLAGLNFLFVLNGLGVEPPVQIDAAPLAIPTPLLTTGLAAFDKDDDGDEDLMLSQSGSHAALIIERGPQIELAAVELPGGTQAPAAVNLCPGVWADLNHDGVPDGLFWLDSIPGKAFVDHMTGVSTVLALDEIIAAAEYGDSGDGLELSLWIPTTIVLDATQLEIVVWHQPDPTASIPAPPLDALGQHFSWTLPIPPPASGHYEVSLPLQPASTTSPFWSGRDHYYLDMRLIDAVAQVVEHAEVVGLTMAWDTGVDPDSFMDYLHSLKGEDPGEILIYPPVTPEIPRPEPIGGIITRKEPPPFGLVIPGIE